MHVPQIPQTPPLPLEPHTLGAVPKAFYLPRGQVLACSGGCLWITSDALAGFGRDSDVVLETGQSFVTPQAATYFVGAPLGWGVLSLLCSTALVANPETTGRPKAELGNPRVVLILNTTDTLDAFREDTPSVLEKRPPVCGQRLKEVF